MWFTISILQRSNHLSPISPRHAGLSSGRSLKVYLVAVREVTQKKENEGKRDKERCHLNEEGYDPLMVRVCVQDEGL